MSDLDTFIAMLQKGKVLFLPNSYTLLDKTEATWVAVCDGPNRLDFVFRDGDFKGISKSP